MSQISFFDALKENKVEIVQEMIREDRRLLWLREKETTLTPLMIASGYGYIQMVKLLLSEGADPLVTDGRAYAFPIHKACMGGHLEIVKLLVQAGASINSQVAATGHTPLIEAIWFKRVDVVEYLLNQNALLNLQTSYGFTLFDHMSFLLKSDVAHQAIFQKIQELIENRQKNDATQIENHTLMKAVNDGDISKVSELLEAGFPVDKRYPILGGFLDFHTALLVAVRDGHEEIAKKLLLAGANPNALECTFISAPLHKATYTGRATLTKLLCEQKEIDLNCQGPTNGYTPLHDALWHAYADCAEILIDAGASLQLKGHDGKRPIDLALDNLGKDSPLYIKLREKMVKS